ASSISQLLVISRLLPSATSFFDLNLSKFIYDYGAFGMDYSCRGDELKFILGRDDPPLLEHEVDDDKRYDARQGCKREHTLVVYPEFGLIRGTYISGRLQALSLTLSCEYKAISQTPVSPLSSFSTTKQLCACSTLSLGVYTPLLPSLVLSLSTPWCSLTFSSSTLVLCSSSTLSSDLFSLLLYCWSFNLKQQLTNR
ncbi:hypothetical protein HID58_009447, partial [Brassica napus]